MVCSAAVCTFSSLPLTAAQESMVCIHHILFIHSPEVGDLDYIPLSAPINGVTVSILVYVLLWVLGQGFSCYSWEWNCWVTGHTQFSASAIRLFMWMAIALYTIYQKCIRTPFLHICNKQHMAFSNVLILPI